MKKYIVVITETLQREVEIMAESGNNALDAVMSEYQDQDIVLDYNDFIDVNFLVKNKD